MNKHIDEGDANLNGTATEDRLGAAAQQAQPEGFVGEGPAASEDAPAAFGADAGDDAGTAVLSEEPAAPVGGPLSGLARLREMFSTPRRERAPRSEKSPTTANIKWARPMPAPRPPVACALCHKPTGTLLRVSEGVYRHKGCRVVPEFRKGGSR